MRGLWVLASMLALWATDASSQTLRPLCPDRGAYQTCIVDVGHPQVELSLADWSSDSESTLLISDAVVRLGLDDLTEVQLAWSPWVRKSGSVGHGDIRLAVRRNLIDQRFSLAVQPMLSLPVGSRSLTQGHVVPGVAVAAMYDLTPRTQLYLTPVILPTATPTRAVFLGVNQSVGRQLGASLELQVQRSPGVRQASVNLTGTWTADRNLEFDLNANMGVTPDTPGIQLIAGVTRRF